MIVTEINGLFVWQHYSNPKCKELSRKIDRKIQVLNVITAIESEKHASKAQADQTAEDKKTEAKNESSKIDFGIVANVPTIDDMAGRLCLRSFQR